MTPCLKTCSCYIGHLESEAKSVELESPVLSNRAHEFLEKNPLLFPGTGATGQQSRFPARCGQMQDKGAAMPFFFFFSGTPAGWGGLAWQELRVICSFLTALPEAS